VRRRCRTSNVAKCAGWRDTTERGERGQERGRERGEPGLGQQGVEGRGQRRDARGKPGGDEVEVLEPFAKGTGARGGERGVSLVERGAQRGLAFVQAPVPARGVGGLVRRHGLEQVGDRKPAVGHGAPQRVLRPERPVGDLQDHAPQPADEGRRGVAAGRGRTLG